MADEFSQEDLQILQKLGATTPQQEEKHSTHSFLHAVATEDDTTKVGNLKEEEVGIPKLSQRTLKELELYSREIADDESWGDYFQKRAEILTSTSLSKDAKLLETAIIQRREVANVSKPRQVNKGWFGKNKQPQPQPQV